MIEKEKQRITLEGNYMTREGNKVIIEKIMLYRGEKKMKYPVKGYYIVNKNNTKIKKSTIWTLNGKISLMSENSPLDLVKV